MAQQEGKDSQGLRGRSCRAGLAMGGAQLWTRTVRDRADVITLNLVCMAVPGRQLYTHECASQCKTVYSRDMAHPGPLTSLPALALKTTLTESLSVPALQLVFKGRVPGPPPCAGLSQSLARPREAPVLPGWPRHSPRTAFSTQSLPILPVRSAYDVILHFSWEIEASDWSWPPKDPYVVVPGFFPFFSFRASRLSSLIRQPRGMGTDSQDPAPCCISSSLLFPLPVCPSRANLQPTSPLPRFPPSPSGLPHSSHSAAPSLCSLARPALSVTPNRGALLLLQKCSQDHQALTSRRACGHPFRHWPSLGHLLLAS